MNNLKDLFLNKHGADKRNLQLHVIFLMLAIMTSITISFNKTYAFVIILFVFTLFIANEYVGIQNNSLTDFNEVTYSKLLRLQEKANAYVSQHIKLLQNHKNGLHVKVVNQMYNAAKLDCLYIDASLIIFLESIIKLFEYNSKGFYDVLIGTNYLLKLRFQVEEYINSNASDGVINIPENITDIYEESIRVKSKLINTMHDFIYTVPKIQTMYRYVETVTDRYNILLTRNIDIIENYYQKHMSNNTINTSTRYVFRNMAKPVDTLADHSISPTKSPGKLISFYN